MRKKTLLIFLSHFSSLFLQAPKLAERFLADSADLFILVFFGLLFLLGLSHPLILMVCLHVFAGHGSTYAQRTLVKA